MTARGLPFVGPSVSRASERVIQAGQSAVASGRASRRSIGDLATLLGITIALLPSIPVLAVSIPLPYARLRRPVKRPWRGLDAQQRAELAAAELERLGLAGHARRTGPGR